MKKKMARRNRIFSAYATVINELRKATNNNYSPEQYEILLPLIRRALWEDLIYDPFGVEAVLAKKKIEQEKKKNDGER
jgi:hypothetical protein